MVLNTTLQINDVRIDLKTGEIVVQFEGTTEAECRVQLSDALGWDDTPGDHQTTVAHEYIDSTAVSEQLADRHGTDADDILVQRIDAPNTVYYDIRED